MHVHSYIKDIPVINDRSTNKNNIVNINSPKLLTARSYNFSINDRFYNIYQLYYNKLDIKKRYLYKYYKKSQIY